MLGAIIGFAAEHGVRTALGYAMKAITPSNAGKISKLLVKVGVWGSAMLIGTGVKEQVDDMLGGFKLKAETEDGKSIEIGNLEEEETEAEAE